MFLALFAWCGWVLAAPGRVSPAAIVFFNVASGMSICPGKVRRREPGLRSRKTLPLAKSYFPPDLPPPGREAGRGPTPGQAGKSQERALPSESKGCPGRRRGQRDRSPRKSIGPGKFQPPCASLAQFLRQFSSRGQSWLPTTRNRGSGRSLTPDFFRGCIGNVRKSGSRQVPRRGKKANRPPPLENPPRGPWPFSSYTHEVSCGEKLLQEQKVEGWGGLLKKIQAPFSRSSCWLASAKPCAAHTGEPTKPVGAVLAGPKEKGVRLIT